MGSDSRSLPTHDQIDQIFLDSAVSGRLSPTDLDMLVNYIRAIRDKDNQREDYIIPGGETGRRH